MEGGTQVVVITTFCEGPGRPYLAGWNVMAGGESFEGVATALPQPQKADPSGPVPMR